jgi:hypothetical protein
MSTVASRISVVLASVVQLNTPFLAFVAMASDWTWLRPVVLG